MKLLKKPFIAILLCVLIVLGSTALSASGGLEKKCAAVIDGFYVGVTSGGESRTAIAASLGELCDIANGMVSIAENYGIAAEETGELADMLRQTLSRREDDIHAVYLDYTALSKYVQTLEEKLYSNGLSERHTELMTEHSARLDALTEDIKSSGYNDSVQSFMNSADRFPTRYIAALFGIQYPQYFG